MKNYKVNGQQVALKHQPDIFTRRETADRFARECQQATWVIKVNGKFWAVCPRDFAALEKAGCTSHD